MNGKNIPISVTTMKESPEIHYSGLLMPIVCEIPSITVEVPKVNHVYRTVDLLGALLMDAQMLMGFVSTAF